MVGRVDVDHGIERIAQAIRGVDPTAEAVGEPRAIALKRVAEIGAEVPLPFVSVGSAWSEKRRSSSSESGPRENGGAALHRANRC